MKRNSIFDNREYRKEITFDAFRGNSNHMLPVVDWMSNYPVVSRANSEWVEVQFKNTRKSYYVNDKKISITKGDIVVVEGSPGYDVGEVVLCSPLVWLQMLKNNIDKTKYPRLSIIRRASESDKLTAQKAHEREIPTMIRARQIASSMGLDMKIGNVEFQGDGKKAIFYYIAEHRVDFRQLIKFYIEDFHVRIEMRQIGVRQEAGGIGGIGPCGRELCCASWKTKFTTIVASSAKIQNLSPNPQKLAGLCAKLRCCINYELPVYEDAVKDFPSPHIVLKTAEGDYFLYSTDPLANKLTYSSESNAPRDLITLTAQQANDIIDQNKKGVKPKISSEVDNSINVNYSQMMHGDVNRFDKKKSVRRKRSNGSSEDV